MSKRLTDTEKWKIAWFRKLSPKMKCAWSFLLDNCDHSGIWHEDTETMSHHVGEEVTCAELEEAFKGKIERFDSDKFFIKAFIDFQYGELNPSNKVHLSVIRKLEKNGIDPKGLGRVKVGACDTVLEGVAEGAIAIAKDINKAKAIEKETSEIPSDILESIKITMQYPDEIIEEIQKDAWIKYQASSKPDKNWKRFFANYIVYEKEAIRNMAIEKGKVVKKPNQNNQAQGMATKIFDEVIANSGDLRGFLSKINQVETRAIDIFGRASEILRCTDFEAPAIKKRLKEACEQAIQEQSKTAAS